ncbi:hypothetical protein CMI47_02215 [Candidatus Pacearchaeota archaeon]|nr:hypothetical protein [Candidatus Pacearchaeota archaeon]|tara:strand:+ start:275 stop:673 length:399 start_codon:yes stop_codon:yes gene_type:complete
MKYTQGLILILILLNVFLAAFIIYTESTETYVCAKGFSCESVLNSKYSETFGIKTSYLGLTYFLVLLLTYTLTYHKKIPQKYFTILAAIGALYAIYFLYIQAFVLKAFCSNCLVVDIAAIIIFALSLNKTKK